MTKQQIKDIMRMIGDNEGINFDESIDMNEDVDFDEECDKLCAYANYRKKIGKELSGEQLFELCGKSAQKFKKNLDSSLNESIRLTEAEDDENDGDETLADALNDEDDAADDELNDDSGDEETTEDDNNDDGSENTDSDDKEKDEKSEVASPEMIRNSISTFANSILSEAVSMVKSLDSFKLSADEFGDENKDVIEVFDLVSTSLNKAIGALQAVTEKYGNTEGVTDGKEEAEKILNTENVNIQSGAKAIEVIKPLDDEDKKDTKEESFKYNYSLEGLNENLDREEDVFDAFMSIMNEEYPYVGKAVKRINESYKQHRDDPIYKAAYKKWKATDEIQIYMSEGE